MSTATSYPKDRINVVLLEAVHQVAADRLHAEGFRVEMVAGALAGDALREVMGRAHVLGIRSKTEVTEDVLRAAGEKLLAIGCFCIGTNQVALHAACERGVPVFNSPFSNTRSVAELTIGETIALTRGLFEKSRKMHAGEWDKSAAGAHEVRGRTMGIVGYGHIGSQVSVLAEAMGMRVVFYDIVPKLALGNARRAATLGEVLEQADVLTLHVPATDATTRLIGARELARMKRGACLINNARGSVVDMEALASALRSGHVGGAALDVFPVEPAGKGDRFESAVCGLKNVILTPHIGGSTEEAQAAIAEDVCAKLARFVNNGSTTGAVNVPQVELPGQGGEEEGGALRRHRILHFHKNLPGVMKKVNGVAADLGANISAQFLQTNADVGYVVLDVDPTDGERLMQGLKRVEETVRVRMLW
ncbi:MAG: phosphoglycerate dehydrogenase [Planctomycetes bacterium]|nr:phosphoglycerate dehydrogenase [Planctomycetota bacterium]